MKKIILWLLVVTVLGTTACTGGNTSEKTDNTVEDNKNTEETKKDDKSNNKQEQEKENTQQNAVKILVYYPNENADGTDTEEMECKELSADNIWSLLKEKKVVAENAAINSFRENGKVLELDVNEAFGEQLRSYGTAGENMLMQSIVNTFLDAYECEQIQITEDGSTLVSGHREYADMIKKYE